MRCKLTIYLTILLVIVSLSGCTKENKNPSLERANTDATRALESNSDVILIKELAIGWGFAIKADEQKQMMVEVTPRDATNISLKWYTTDNNIASIDEKTGLLTAKSKGSCKIFAEALDGSGVKDSCTIYVVEGSGEWKNTPDRKITNPSLPYYLYFEKDTFTISVYGQGDDGYYSKLVKTISSSRGRTLNMTPTGVFTLKKQKRWYQFKIGKYWTQYCIKYHGDLYLHGPLYKKKSGDTMYVSEYNRIGTPSTSGCLAMPVKDIKWIWENCPDGTKLEIVAGSPVGYVAPAPRRLGKNEPAIDPTDPEFS